MLRRILIGGAASVMLSGAVVTGPLAETTTGEVQGTSFQDLLQSSPTADLGQSIAGWVEDLDMASGWSAGYADLDYDQAMDTYVLTGLTIEFTAADIAIAFEPISITGYIEQDDNTFDIETFAIGGAAATGEGFKIEIADFRLDELGDVPMDLDLESTLDPQRPFTSIIELYSRYMDTRLKHGIIGSVSMSTVENGIEVTIDYENFTMDDWANGKLAAATIGAIKMAMPGGRDAMAMTYGGVEMRDLDYAAILRVFDGDQAVGGGADRNWRTAVGLVQYNDIVVDTPESRVAIGTVKLEDLRVRQPEQSIREFFDKAFLDPLANEDPSPEDIRAILGFFSSFSLGLMSVQDINVDAPEGSGGHLQAVTFSDFSSEGLGEFSIDDLFAEHAEEGSFKLGRFAIGGLVFPSLETLLAAAEAEEAGRDFDFSEITAQLGFVEVQDIDLDIPDVPNAQLGKMRLDLGNYVGPIPTSLGLEIIDANLPASAIDDSTMRAMWQSLGYDRILGEFTAKLAWNESDETISVDDFRFSVDDVGAISMEIQLGGLSRRALEDLESLPDAVTEMTLVRGALTVEDYDILDRWVDQQASNSGAAPDEIREQLAVMLSNITASIGESSFQDRLNQVLTASILLPGSVTASATPAAPVPVAALALLAEMAPATLPELLGLSISHNSE
jgi:hypothetical protein